MEEMDEMGCLVLVDLKDKEETKDRRETKEQQVPLDLEVVEWSTQGGGKVAVQVSQVYHTGVCREGWWNMVCT